jgi:hypothetical protein
MGIGRGNQSTQNKSTKMPFFHHKSYKTWPGIEPGQPRLTAWAMSRPAPVSKCYIHVIAFPHISKDLIPSLFLTCVYKEEDFQFLAYFPHFEKTQEGL